MIWSDVYGHLSVAPIQDSQQPVCEFVFVLVLPKHL